MKIMVMMLLSSHHILHGVRIAQLVEHRTHGQKVAGVILSRSSRRIFFSRVNFLRWLLLGVCSIPMSPQWHVKDPNHSAKSAGGRLQLNTQPLTQRSLSGLTMLTRYSVGTYQENKLTHNSCGNTCPQSPQSAKPLWSDPSLKTGTSACKLIST